MTLLHYEPPVTPYLRLIYRDDHLVVVDKPSGLLSVPGRAPEHFDSVHSRVVRVLPEAKLVHRLDMATSGIMLFAIGKPAQSHLSRQFQQRTTQKVYHALVDGDLPAHAGVIDLPLACDWPNRPRQQIDYVHGKASQTLYRTLSTSEQHSRIELTPISGRSHQLRVHMQALGTPIIGDKFYAHPQAFNKASRLLLHAHKLSVTHPATEQPIAFVSPTPF